MPRLTKFIVEKVVVKLLDLGLLASMVAYIRFDVNKDVSDFKQIVNQIQEKLSKKKLSDEEHREFNEKLSNAALDLIRFNTLKLRTKST